MGYLAKESPVARPRAAKATTAAGGGDEAGAARASAGASCHPEGSQTNKREYLLCGSIVEPANASSSFGSHLVARAGTRIPIPPAERVAYRRRRPDRTPAIARRASGWEKFVEVFRLPAC